MESSPLPVGEVARSAGEGPAEEDPHPALSRKRERGWNLHLSPWERSRVARVRGRYSTGAGFLANRNTYFIASPIVLSHTAHV